MRGLPLEVYKRIFLYLKQKDLQTCYFVCKRWYSIAIPLNWQEVTVDNSSIGLIISYLHNLNHGQYFKYGHLITNLIILDKAPFRSVTRHKFSKPELLVLLHQLPNLKVIDLSESNYIKKYMGFLLDADLQHINTIHTEYSLSGHFADSYTYDLLFLVCYRFRDSITNVLLHYDKSTIDFNSQQLNTLNALTEFKNLTELELHNKHDVNLTPFQLQDFCPHLKHLTFCSDYPISESVMLDRLNSKNKMLNFATSLTHLKLELPSLSAAYTKYLVDYFPHQLVEINIEVTIQSPFIWVEIVGMELALQFMEKSGRIEESFFYFQCLNRYEVPPNQESNMTKYFKLLNAFRGNRQTYCEAEFTETNEVEGADCLFHHNGKYNLFTTYCIHDNDFHGPDLDLPDKTSSEIGPEIFDSLKFDIWREHGDVVYNTLKYSFSNCPKLKEFVLNFFETQSEDIVSSIRYKHEDSLAGSEQASSGINYLRIEYIGPAQRYFDLVAARLPHIEGILLESKDWGREYDNSVMDLTGFEKLKSFIYKTSSDNDEDGQDNDAVLLKYTNGEEEYRSIDKGAENPTTPCLTIFCDPSVVFDFQKNEMEF